MPVRRKVVGSQIPGWLAKWAEGTPATQLPNYNPFSMMDVIRPFPEDQAAFRRALRGKIKGRTLLVGPDVALNEEQLTALEGMLRGLALPGAYPAGPLEATRAT